MFNIEAKHFPIELSYFLYCYIFVVTEIVKENVDVKQNYQ